MNRRQFLAGAAAAAVAPALPAAAFDPVATWREVSDFTLWGIDYGEIGADTAACIMFWDDHGLRIEHIAARDFFINTNEDHEPWAQTPRPQLAP